MNKLDLEPSQVVVDLVLAYSATMPRLGQVAVLNGNLILAAKNHRGQYVSFAFPVHFAGEAVDGPEPRWVLHRLGATVWKLAPSFLHDMLHAYLTIVDVPEGIDWGKS